MHKLQTNADIKSQVRYNFNTNCMQAFRTRTATVALSLFKQNRNVVSFSQTLETHLKPQIDFRITVGAENLSIDYYH